MKMKAERPRQKGTFENKWVLPFPTTISNDLNLVIVLRTVYILRQSPRTEPTLTYSSEAPIRSITIPVQIFDLRTTRNLSDQNSQPCPEPQNSTKTGSPLRFSYAYKFQISNNNHYILFEGAAGLNVHPQSKPQIMSLTVFKFEASETRLRCHPVANFGNFRSERLFTLCSIHPVLPLILCHCRSFVHESGIVLWAFASEPPPERELSSNQKFFDHVFSNPLDSLQRPECLNFSACGTQFIVKFSEAFLPQVHSITSDPVYQWALSQVQSANYEDTVSDKRNSQRLTKFHHGPMLDSRSTNFDIGQITATQSSSTQAVLSTKNARRDIQIKHRTSEGVEETQPLLSLPRWEGLDAVSVGVHACSRDEKIRIVLNKAAQPSYSLDEPAEVKFPAVIKKDARALVHKETKTIEMSRKRTASRELLRESGSGRSDLRLQWSSEEQD
jgi:hypothetical protein